MFLQYSEARTWHHSNLNSMKYRATTNFGRSSLGIWGTVGKGSTTKVLIYSMLRGRDENPWKEVLVLKWVTISSEGAMIVWWGIDIITLLNLTQ